jgi:protocatechuate 3,4-dioxygenase beta subunit
MHPSIHPRRHVLAAGVAGIATLSLPAALRALAAEALRPTPAQTEGPFYPLNYPADTDSDLVHVAGHAEPAKGTVTQVAGHVLDRTGRPMARAQVEIWQCDNNGRYHNVRDGGGERPRDDNFQGFGRTVTDDKGGYHFVTIRPVPYPGRTPHIHFSVTAPGQRRFITQMYVEGEPGNERDAVLLGVVDPAARARLIVPLRPAPELGREALAGEFDIVLGEG